MQHPAACIVRLQSKRKVFCVYEMKEYRGVEVELHSFLTSVPDGAQWLIHTLADSPVAID
jgi:hypothetical protein